jgi:hypothetical protein
MWCPSGVPSFVGCSDGRANTFWPANGDHLALQTLLRFIPSREAPSKLRRPSDELAAWPAHKRSLAGHSFLDLALSYSRCLLSCGAMSGRPVGPCSRTKAPSSGSKSGIRGRPSAFRVSGDQSYWLFNALSMISSVRAQSGRRTILGSKIGRRTLTLHFKRLISLLHLTAQLTKLRSRAVYWAIRCRSWRRPDCRACRPPSPESSCRGRR